jgi:hypothetical protein
MQPKLIGHVCNFVLLVCGLFYDLRAGGGIGIGETSLAESAFEDFHEAMGICVVVDWRAFPRSPDEDKL